MDNYHFDAAPVFHDEIFDGVVDNFGAAGRFKIEHWRKGKFLQYIDFHNGITAQGLNHILAVEFAGGIQIPTWYIFPISNVGYTALNSADTMASHTGWNESVAYSETGRVQWTAGIPTGGAISNAAQMILTISADGTALIGMGICSVATKNTTTGILWATGLFAGVQNMSNGDVLKITYTSTLTATS